MNGDFSQKLNQVLSNPAMMAQIKALADTMTENNQTSSETKPEKESDFSYRETAAEPISEKPFVPPFFTPSPSFEKNLQNACTLLSALKPFLDSGRQEKIDKMLSMMHFAQMAGQFGNFF
ncbi:MAG: hypothetical protein E7603_03900 [Ruminococcaceae bacterium]|nr:hypothetical protein [Oscillospiraceae bacterium]